MKNNPWRIVYSNRGSKNLRKQSSSISTSRSKIVQRVVVTGLGVVCPLGVGVSHSWSKLVNGVSGSTSITDQRFSNIPSKVAAYVPRGEGKGELNLSQHFKPGDSQRMGLSMQFGVIAAGEALEDAGWRPGTRQEKMRTGVAVGMGMVDLEYIGNCALDMAKGSVKKISPYFVPRILPNLSPGHISIKFGLEGPNHSCSTACATSSHAIGDAYRMIERGDADVMVAGGVDSCINPLAVAGFSRARALSTKYNDRPEVASRPFDKGRDGFVIGEGAGVVVLESLDHALARDARIYCEVLGYGLSGDASHITAAREDGMGALNAMSNALKDLPEDAKDHLWMVNCHATSTPIGDMAEMSAVRKLLKTTKSEPYVTSNKGSVGHLLGAAGGVESVFSIMAMNENIIPPSINIENIDHAVAEGLNIVANVKTESSSQLNVPDNIPKKLTLKNSFGFGGTNVSLVFGQCQDY